MTITNITTSNNGKTATLRQKSSFVALHLHGIAEPQLIGIAPLQPHGTTDPQLRRSELLQPLRTAALLYRNTTAPYEVQSTSSKRHFTSFVYVRVRIRVIQDISNKTNAYLWDLNLA